VNKARFGVKIRFKKASDSNYSMSRWGALILLLLLLMSSTVSAARIYGEIYEWSSLEKMGNVVIDINSSPQQTIVSKQGDYSFTVPEGHYNVQAVYVENGRIALMADENIDVQSEGEFILDLIMFPPLDVSDLDELGLNDFDVNQEVFEEEQPTGYGWEIVAILVIAALALAAVTYYLYNKPPEGETIKPVIKKKTKKKVMKAPAKAMPQLDKYAQEVVEALKRSGNRLTQKELRDKVSVGEAKVSLIVAELEQMGLVKKIKRGRGNIIILKK
jgi:uncharacterized membrane protein